MARRLRLIHAARAASAAPPDSTSPPPPPNLHCPRRLHLPTPLATSLPLLSLDLAAAGLQGEAAAGTRAAPDLCTGGARGGGGVRRSTGANCLAVMRDGCVSTPRSCSLLQQLFFSLLCTFSHVLKMQIRLLLEIV
jgi:hypothetical protein